MTDATDTAAHPAVEAPSGTLAETQPGTLDNNQGSFAGTEGGADRGDADGEHTDDQGHGQSDDAEHDEIEHDGKRYRIPSALKSAFMMHGDYTRKTQELAAVRRSLDAERETFSRSALTHVADFGRLTSLDQDIAKYANVDWQKLATDDPFA